MGIDRLVNGASGDSPFAHSRRPSLAGSEAIDLWATILWPEARWNPLRGYLPAASVWVPKNMPIDLRPPPPTALIAAIMAPDEMVLGQVRGLLAERIAPIRALGPAYPFAFSTYYEKEMGPGLLKQLLCFEGLVDPAVLPQVKGQLMALERELGREEGGQVRRRVNLDPGLVTIESLVLASTKYSGHRVGIGPGLYAEVTLLFQKGQYRPLEWTYQDFRTEEAQAFLLEIRAWLLPQRLRGGAP